MADMVYGYFIGDNKPTWEAKTGFEVFKDDRVSFIEVFEEIDVVVELDWVSFN